MRADFEQARVSSPLAAQANDGAIRSAVALQPRGRPFGLTDAAPPCAALRLVQARVQAELEQTAQQEAENLRLLEERARDELKEWDKRYGLRKCALRALARLLRRTGVSQPERSRDRLLMYVPMRIAAAAFRGIR